jgi:hypothetical protein
MFVVSTYALGESWAYGGFLLVSRVSMFVALFAWSLVALGLLRSGIRWALAPEAPTTQEVAAV